ncbi:class I SAM-dependent methyltransferase [Plastoroseomonas arctica]|uniref:Class I SAM-dependent methyltransferase n=1 Tax=Plastoroseomonas arctica TaxID=1509237 RepID=A0AAF1K788_9PROT|nr:class I SAM-dependent methyltransferase [Plastoroseomonas arctica]MBR0657500.1 class I SAM-dependent methyltransferase [Plastoroseomonas arctica]
MGTGGDAATRPAAAQPPWSGYPLRDCIAYLAAGHRSVRGFLTTGGAFLFLTILEVQRRDKIVGSIAEIGTYHGRSFIAFGLSLLAEERLVAIDLFEDNGEDFEPALRANCLAHGVPASRMRIHRADSREIGPVAWATLLGLPARLVHVDGEHSRLAARHDLTLAASSLAPGGLMVADDVLHPWFPDVTLAVADFLETHRELRAIALLDRQGPLSEGGPKVVIAAEADAARYQDAFRATMSNMVIGNAAFAGSTPLLMSADAHSVKGLLAMPA